MGAVIRRLKSEVAGNPELGMRLFRLRRRHGPGFLTALIFVSALLIAALFPISANAESPGVTTKAADGVTSTAATLHGAVNPHGFETSYRFEYGTTTSYGTSVPVPDKGAGSGTSLADVSEKISGLGPGTTYHFRVAAISAEGSSFGKDETFTTKFLLPLITADTATFVTSSTAILNATINPNGLATTYRFEYGTTTSYGTSVPVPDKGIGSGLSGVKVSEGIGGLAGSTTYHFRVVATNAEGTSVGSDKTFTTEKAIDPRFSFAFGSKGLGEGQFMMPRNAVFDSTGDIWVTDSFNRRVQKFDATGKYLSKFGKEGLGKGKFMEPTDIDIDSEGNIWVLDASSQQVQKFDSKGEFLSEFGSKGSGNGQFDYPQGMVIDSADNIWVTDLADDRVQKFNSKGTYQSKFGTSGEGNGQFDHPMGIAIDPAGYLWVADTWNHRIQKFNSKGEYEGEIGTEGSGDGELNLPSDIAFDSTGYLWVADTYNHRIQRFSPEGEYLSQFGGEGSGTAEFLYPTNVVVDSADNVWVTDDENSRIQKWIPNRPTAITNAAGEVTSSAATLYGSVTPNGLATTYRFEYGTTTSYGTSVPVPSKGIGSGSSPVNVSEKISGLKTSTTYHFRVVATSAEGISFGKDETFVTK